MVSVYLIDYFAEFSWKIINSMPVAYFDVLELPAWVWAKFSSLSHEKSALVSMC